MSVSSVLDPQERYWRWKQLEVTRESQMVRVSTFRTASLVGKGLMPAPYQEGNLTPSAKPPFTDICYILLTSF